MVSARKVRSLSCFFGGVPLIAIIASSMLPTRTTPPYARLDQMHSALEARVKVTLAAPSGQDLRLDDHALPAKALGRLVCLVSALCRDGARCRDAVLAQQIHRQVFVNGEEALLLLSNRLHGASSTEDAVGCGRPRAQAAKGERCHHAEE